MSIFCQGTYLVPWVEFCDPPIVVLCHCYWCWNQIYQESWQKRLYCIKKYFVKHACNLSVNGDVAILKSGNNVSVIIIDLFDVTSPVDLSELHLEHTYNLK